MSKNRTEMHKFLERLISGKNPEEAVAMLKEILVDYFGFGSSIELDELALILGKISKDYNETEPEVEEEVEDKEGLEDIQKQIAEILKRLPAQTPVPQQPSLPYPQRELPCVQPSNPLPWTPQHPQPGDFPFDRQDWKYTMKSSGVEVTPENFQMYVGSLSKE